jgi:hypothetical protein
MARRAKKDDAPANGIKVDFTGVETRILLPEGIYEASVKEIKHEGGADGYLAWKFTTIDDDPKLNDKVLYNNTSLKPQSLWVLGQLLDTLGVERPDGAMDIDFDELLGLELQLVVEHEEYEGKIRAKVVDFSPAGGDAEEGDVVETVNDGEGGDTYTTDEINEMDAEELATVLSDNDLTAKASKKIAVFRANVLKVLDEEGLIDDDADGDADAGDDAGDGEADGGDTYTEDEINAMDADELAEVVEANDLKVKAIKKLSRYRANVIAALEEADLIGTAEEGGDDDTYTEDEVNEMDAEELAEVITKHELEVKAIKNLKKFRAAVIDALEAEDLIEDDE